MNIWILSLCLIIISLLSGLFGRMGGAGKSGQWYDKILDTKWRDCGCSILNVLTLCLFLPFQLKFWWIYLIIFGLHWASYSTYWDWLFKYDNLWFSGFMVGLSMMPALFINPLIWYILILRAIILAVIWGLLNIILPNNKIFGHDVTEEFLRYFFSQ
jgi:hypothetical protein